MGAKNNFHRCENIDQSCSGDEVSDTTDDDKNYKSQQQKNFFSHIILPTGK